MREMKAVSTITLMACALALGCGQAPTGPSDPSESPGTAAEARASSGQGHPHSWQFYDEQGWNCRLVPNTQVHVCSPPGQPLPVVAIPPAVPPADRPPTVLLKRWINGVFDANVHLVRPEIYNGQICGSTGKPYTFAAVLGYFECPHG